MRTIALFTDFGQADAYVAQMKGVILSMQPAVTVLDLNHEVGQFDIRQAAYLLAASCRYFPAATIFVVVVDPGVGTRRRPVLLQTRADKYYIGPDNGVFTHVMEQEGVQRAYVLQHPEYFRSAISTTFHGRDIFAPVAAHLASGVDPEAFGPEVDDLLSLPVARAQRQDEVLTGEVIHVDRYGNIITNIPATFLDTVGFGQTLSVTCQERTWQVPFVATYGVGQAGQCLGLINSSDTFELALPQESAAAVLQVRVGQRLTLRL